MLFRCTRYPSSIFDTQSLSFSVSFVILKHKVYITSAKLRDKNHVVRLRNAYLHPSFTCLLYKECRATSFVWNWHLYIAGSYNPCVSIPDAKGYALYIWMKCEAPGQTINIRRDEDENVLRKIMRCGWKWMLSLYFPRFFRFFSFIRTFYCKHNFLTFLFVRENVNTSVKITSAVCVNHMLTSLLIN